MSARKKNTKPTARKPLSPEAEAKVKYRRMVAAVREWLAIEHPHPMSNRIDICLYADTGGGETLACFHASADDAYVLGDLMAMPDD